MTHLAIQQAATARWMGYSSADEMNAEHDDLHRAMCAWLAVPSHSMMAAKSEPHDSYLAILEEEAVMHLQRFMAHCGVGVPA